MPDADDQTPDPIFGATAPEPTPEAEAEVLPEADPATTGVEAETETEVVTVEEAAPAPEADPTTEIAPEAAADVVADDDALTVEQSTTLAEAKHFLKIALTRLQALEGSEQAEFSDVQAQLESLLK